MPPESQQGLCRLGDLIELFTPYPWGEIPHGRVLPCRVVALNPGHDDAFGLFEGREVMPPDTFLLQGAEESLDHPVVVWRVPRNELLGDRELLGSPDEQAGQENGAVVVPEPQALGRLGETPKV